MSFNFQLSLYLTTKYNYDFVYPVDSNKQTGHLREELKLTKDEFVEWKPSWELLPMFVRDEFLAALSNDFSYVSEIYSCRETAVCKGSFYDLWQSNMSIVFRQAYTTLTYPTAIPIPFKDVITSALLDPYGVNKTPKSVRCDLDSNTFGIGMKSGYWNKAWISLLTYFVKYGEFMWEISDVGYTDKFSLDQAVRAILDSWSGQVGFYTAFGLWLWANKDNNAIHADHDQFNGIHTSMDHYSSLYAPHMLVTFIKQYSLGLDRVSRLFLDNHGDKCRQAGLAIPPWYAAGGDNDYSLSESPEWNDYMGYDNEDEYGDHEEDDLDEDDYDFEEEW